MSIRHQQPHHSDNRSKTTTNQSAATAKTEVTAPYAVLAPFYDALLGHFRGRFEAVRDGVLGTSSAPGPARPGAPGIFCDLGCGTGTSCLQMAFRGWQSHGVDLSPAMLEAARAKLARVQEAPPAILSWLATADHRRLRRMSARDAQATLRPLTAEFHQAGFTDFRLPAPADFMTCLFDSLNHLPNTCDLTPALKAVHANLRPGGLLLCDLNTPRAIRETWSSMKPEIHEDPAQGYLAIVRGGSYDRARRQASLHWTWFLRDGSADRTAASPWRRIEETYREVAWSRAELHRAFKAARLKLRWWKDAGDLHPGFEHGWRWFILAERR
ncbi:MAG TPA: class I SAM-dependent methyltransferase [Planctomycetota bacterium]|nr:class I SAM-dependent methyltransferase [Planctomycetota bacterium]